MGMQQRPTADTVGAQSVQDRGVESGQRCERRIGVEGVAVAVEPVEESLIASRLEAEHVVGFSVGECPVRSRATVTTLHLAQEVLRAAGVQVPIRFVPWGKANVHLRVPDISQARGLLGYEPAVDLAEGLGKTIGWYRELDDVGTVP